MKALVLDNHPAPDQLIQYLHDELAQNEAAAVTIHLETCLQCQEVLDELSDGSHIDFWSEYFFDHSLLDDGKTFVHRSTGAGGEEPKAIQLEPRNEVPFQLKREIARGGMGVVFQAYDTDLQRQIAVKMLRLDSKQETRLAAEARFQREARISGQLQHPGVVPIHEIGRLPDGRMYIAMKLVDGQSMDMSLRDRSASRERMLEVFQSVCNTMAYAHTNNVIHRDLKPANIMVGSFGEVQVMDWGLAKDLGSDDDGKTKRFHDFDGRFEETAKICIEKTHTGLVMGTPAYMAPEQAQGLEVDKRADVFSLGAILCEILTASPPFKTRKEKIKTRKNRELLDRAFARLDESGAEPELISLAKDCLAVDKEKRPLDAKAVSARLMEYFDRRVDLLKESEIERARNKERLVLESKRRKQVLLLGIAIGAFFLCTTIASILYLSEKNASQVERFNDQIQKENKIREIMNASAEWQNRAVAAAESEQSRLWAEALTQLSKAEVLLDDTVNHTIRTSFLQDKRSVEKAAETAAQKSNQRLKDRKTKAAIYDAIKATQTPDENLRVMETPELVDLFATTFAQYGIKIHDNVETVSDIIEKSSIKEDLINGLQIWYSQIDWAFHFSKTYDEKSWFFKVLNNVDPDPYRVNLRYFLYHRKWGKLFEELESPNAVASKFTTHLFIEGFKKISDEERRVDIGVERYAKSTKDYLIRASVRHPDDFRINLFLAQNLSNGGSEQLRVAMRHWLVCLSIQPDNAYVGLALASVLTDLGEYELAEKYYRRFWNHPERYPQSLTNLAMMCEKTGDYEKGVRSCDQVLKHYPEFVKAHFNRSVLLSRMQRYDESLESAKSALKFEPDFSPACYQIAWLYNRENKFEIAHDFALKAVQLRPDCSQSWGLLANIREQIGSATELVECFEKMVELRPESLQHWLGYANYLIDVGDTYQAISILEVKFVDTQLEIRAQAILGKAMVKLGLQEIAIAHLISLQAQNPDDVDVNKILKWAKTTARRESL